MLRVFLMMVDLLKLILQIILILVDKLNKNGVRITAEPSDKSMHPILSVLLSWFPMLLINWCLDIFYETNARWWRKSLGLW